MKFGKQLDAHIKGCESRPMDPCRRADYVDYGHLKRRIRQGLSEAEFQQCYKAELARFTNTMRQGMARDPQFAEINKAALDKISKKFDRRHNGGVRLRNRQEAAAATDAALARLQLDDLSGAAVPGELVLPAEQTRPQAGWLVFAAGAFSGVVSRSLTAPLDRIKLMMQAGNAPRGSGQEVLRVSGRQGRMLGTGRVIWANGGLRGFWQGNGTNVLKVMPESAVKFYVYDRVKSAIQRGSERQLSIPERLAAGSVAGGLAQVCVYPLDVTKTRLAVSSAGTYRGMLHCLTRTVATEGPLALYRGVGVALAAIVPAAAIDLAVYNTLRVRYEEANPGRQMPIVCALG